MPMRFLRPLERVIASPPSPPAATTVAGVVPKLFETEVAEMLTMLLLLLEPITLAFSSFSIAAVVFLSLLLDLDFVPFPDVSAGAESSGMARLWL